MIPQVIILSVLIFLLAKMMPGDPFTGLINPNQDPKVIEAMREAAGLNDPWYEQYFRWIGNALHGDFGHSFIFKLPVSTLIAGRGEYDCIGRCVSYNHVFNRHSFRFNCWPLPKFMV